MAARAAAKSYLGQGEWWALASALCYALGNVMTRIVSVTGDPLAGTVIRTLPVALIGLALMRWRHPETVRRLLPGRPGFFGWRVLAYLIAYCVVITPVTTLALYLAFRYGGVLITVPIISMHPMWAAIVAVPFLAEAFTLRTGAGILVSVLGIGLLTYGQHVGTPVSTQWPLGVAYALLTSFGFAAGANLNRYLIPRGVDVFSLLGLTNIATVIVLGLSLLVAGRFGGLFGFTSSEVSQVLLSGALSGIASFTLFTAFAFTTVASATTLKSLDAGLASVIAVLLLGEQLNGPVLLGLGLILGGVVVVQLSKAQLGTSAETSP